MNTNQIQPEGHQQLTVQEPQLVVLIIKDVEYMEAILNRWEEAGASGATILDCIGRTQLREALCMDDVPLFPSLADLTASENVVSKLLFTLVANTELAEQLIQVSQEELGSKTSGKGLLFTVPVGQFFGLGKTRTP